MIKYLLRISLMQNCKIVKPVVDYAMRGLCRTPYYNHKKGCINWGNQKRKQCPPHGPKIEEIIDLDREVYCIYNKFDLGSHIEKMRQKHPEWSIYQLRCVLYWQGKARKQLKSKIMEFLRLHNKKNFVVISCPEGCGVNLTETMKQIDIQLEWTPEKWAYQIALIGYKK